MDKRGEATDGNGDELAGIIESISKTDDPEELAAIMRTAKIGGPVFDALVGRITELRMEHGSINRALLERMMEEGEGSGDEGETVPF